MTDLKTRITALQLELSALQGEFATHIADTNLLLEK